MDVVLCTGHEPAVSSSCFEKGIPQAETVDWTASRVGHSMVDVAWRQSLVPHHNQDPAIGSEDDGAVRETHHRAASEVGMRVTLAIPSLLTTRERALTSHYPTVSSGGSCLALFGSFPKRRNTILPNVCTGLAQSSRYRNSRCTASSFPTTCAVPSSFSF